MPDTREQRIDLPVEEIERLQRADALLTSILENSPFLISAKDLTGVVTLANNRFTLLDIPPLDQFVGRSVFDLFPPDVAQALWANDQQAVREARCIEAEEEVAHKDGSLHTYLTVKFPLRGGGGAITGSCALSVDITDTKRAVRDSLTDELTGIPNRRALNQDYPEEAQRALRHGEVLNLALIDIDHFKAYNDSCGHDRGDDALRRVASALRLTLARAGDRLFRVGGEEFVALFVTQDEQGAQRHAEDIRRAAAELQLPHPALGSGQVVTISVGLASLPLGESRDLDTLYHRADAALYRAKSTGRNCVVVAP